MRSKRDVANKLLNETLIGVELFYLIFSAMETGRAHLSQKKKITF